MAIKDTPERIITIRELADQYYKLEDGALIEKHAELLRVLDIQQSKHASHPHKDKRVYISRMALKHFVEERRGQLSKHHSAAEVLLRIGFAIKQIPETMINFDKYEYEADGEKHFYTKYFPDQPSVRILCEVKNDALEICSMHFKKKRKEKDK